MRIKNKISLSFIVIFLISLVAIGGVFDFYASRLIKEDAYAYLSASNQAQAEHIRTFIKEKTITSEVLASASVFIDFLSEPVSSGQYKIIKGKIDKRLARTLKDDTSIHQVLILDRTGKVVASTNKPEEGLDKSQDEVFTGAQKGTHFKSIYYSDIINGPAYAISSPIFDDKGNLLGISVLRYPANDFYPIVASQKGLGKTEENILFDRNRFFVSPSAFLGSAVILTKKTELPEGRDCFDPKEVAYVKANGYNGLSKIETHPHIFSFADYRGVEVTGTHSYIPESDWCLITKVDTADLLSYRYSLIGFIVLILLVAGSLLFFVGYLIAGRITRPLSSLNRFTERIKQGRYDFKSNVETNDEIGELSNSFNLMAKAVEKSQSEIEDKVEDQTKELKAKTEQLEKQKLAMLNIMEDIEKEKDKTLALAKDLEKFKLAVDNASDHIVITDAEGTIIYANKGVERVTGYKREEVIGKKSGSRETWGGFMPKDFYQSLWDTIKVKKQNFIGEIENRRKNGDNYTVLASISPVLDDKGEVLFFVGIERDITKEKEIDQAKTEFVSLASHQLRTPLAAINWYTEMLLDGDAGELKEEQRKYLKEVETGNRRMIDLVNALLNVSRLDLGTFMIEPTPVDVVEISRSVLSELQSQIQAKKIVVTEEYNPQIPNPYPADERLLRMVLQNLLSNAVKYTRPEGKVTIKILPLAWGKSFGGRDLLGDSLAISVADNGIGIPAGQRDKIFSKLFRADNARENETEGTGLGLYIVKSIAEQSGGEVWFDSIEDKGATFYVTLPLSGMRRREGEKKLS